MTALQLDIITLVQPPLDTNCYIVADHATGDAVIIDPGTPTAEMDVALDVPGRRILAILNTHGHIDHIAGNTHVRRKTAAPILIHPDAAPALSDGTQNLASYAGVDFEPHQADRLVRDGERLEIGPLAFDVIECSGHARGHVAFRIGPHFFGGDFIFRGGIGRTDIPGSSSEVMARSLRRAFLPLPDDTIIYPGHGPTTTVRNEKRHNVLIQQYLEEYGHLFR